MVRESGGKAWSDFPRDCRCARDRTSMPFVLLVCSFTPAGAVPLQEAQPDGSPVEDVPNSRMTEQQKASTVGVVVCPPSICAGCGPSTNGTKGTTCRKAMRIPFNRGYSSSHAGPGLSLSRPLVRGSTNLPVTNPCFLGTH